MPIKLSSKGNFSKTFNFFDRIKKKEYLKILDKYGEMGLQALSAATPVDTGKTAASWGYEIHYSKEKATIAWTNSNTSKGIPIVVLIQYGHGTRNGGFVQGRDFINPAMRPIFDSIAEQAWQEVTRN